MAKTTEKHYLVQNKFYDFSVRPTEHLTIQVATSDSVRKNIIYYQLLN